MCTTLHDAGWEQVAAVVPLGWIVGAAAAAGSAAWFRSIAAGARRCWRWCTSGKGVDVDRRVRGRRRERRVAGWRVRISAAWRHMSGGRDTDPLTGLANRTGFQRLLEAGSAKLGAEAALTVLVIDLDAFVPLNESLGPAAGDRLLRHVARRLRTRVDPSARLGRLSGHAFAVCLEGDMSATDVAGLARQLMAAVSAPMTSGGRVLALSCSAGAAMSPLHGDWSRLVGNAEAAVASAKRAGGATFALYAMRMKTNPSADLLLQHDLRRALDRGELHLCFQPKVDARTLLVTGVEALVRWKHPGRGLLGPDMFVPVAERFGLIGALGAWVLDATCRQLRAWEEIGLRIPTSFNVSVFQLRQDDLAMRIRRAVEAHGVDPALLTLEITESVAMDDAEVTRALFCELADVGVTLSIDDFGTGYSSLSYLRKLPATQLKIDRSFVLDLEHSGDARAVVDAVVRLARALGLKVVAEGVETQGQRAILQGLGCDELQGYLFSKPITAEVLSALASPGDRPAQLRLAPALFRDERHVLAA